MIILTISGNPHNGNTRAITDLFLSEFENNEVEVDDIVLPKDMPDLCNGCAKCILHDEKECPHYQKVNAILRKMEAADVIILATPVYVMSCSAAMKALLDHFAYMWMVHRPNPKMFNKIGVIITTSAGWGQKETVKLMKNNLFFLGISNIFSYDITTTQMGGNYSSCKNKAKIKAQIHRMAESVKKALTKRKPSLKMRFYFSMFRMSQKNGWNKTDSNYWKRMGWLDGKKPF